MSVITGRLTDVVGSVYVASKDDWTIVPGKRERRIPPPRFAQSFGEKNLSTGLDSIVAVAAVFEVVVAFLV